MSVVLLTVNVPFLGDHGHCGCTYSPPGPPGLAGDQGDPGIEGERGQLGDEGDQGPRGFSGLNVSYWQYSYGRKYVPQAVKTFTYIVNQLKL